MLTIIKAAMTALLVTGNVTAGEFDSHIPMRESGVATYYVDADIQGVGTADFMVDTGSGYMTINEDTLARLQRSGGVVYLRELTGMLADGRTVTVPLYRVAQLVIGSACVLRDVDAAVFPGSTRQILGLSALRQAAPFIFSTDPPQLILSHCTARVAQSLDE